MKIPFMLIRGGSSKGIYFLKSDLPADEKERNEVILKVMEGTLEGDARQIDGLGGANSLTSKVAIISISEKEDCDLDYFFIQVVVGKGRISTTQTCGNILAGVLPFAIETGLIKAQNGTTSAKINIVNTAGTCECLVETPEGHLNYAGEVKIDGVVGTAAPIICNYLDTIGATCGSLLPTGKIIETIEGVETTCIDNGMPLVLMLAADFGLSGYEDKENLDANAELKAKIEKIRLEAGKKMNLGDVAKQTIPKMCLVSKALNGGAINTRMFIPHVIHEAIGVLAAVSVATACIIPGSICSKILNKEKNINESKSGNSNPIKTSGRPQTEHINELDSNNHSSLTEPSDRTHHSSLSIEHPSGEFTVNLEFEEGKNGIQIKKSGVVRTARIIAKGEAFY